MSNPKLATEAQVQEVSDTFIEIINHQGKQIKALESGVIDAIEPSSPAPTKRGEYKVTKPGVFLNFKDANGQPISVTQEDYSKGNVSIIYNGTDCRVLIVPITFEGEVKEGDTRGVSGGTINSTLDYELSKKDKKTIPLSNKINGSFIYEGEIRDNKNFARYEYNYNGEVNVRLKMKASGQGIHLVNYFDINDIWLGQEISFTDITGNTNIDQLLNIKDRTTKIVINASTGNNTITITGEEKLSRYNFEAIDIIDENQKEITYLKITPQVEIEGKFIAADGNYKVGNSYKITEFKDEDFKNIYVTTTFPGNTNINVVHYYNINNEDLGSEYYEVTTTPTTFSRLKISPPTSTSKIAVNSSKAAQVSLELKEVGDYINISTLKQQVDELSEVKLDGKTMKVVIDPKSFYIRTAFDSIYDVIINYIYDAFNNNVSPNHTYFGLKTETDQTILSNMIHNNWDSTGPVWMPQYWYLFAQHGYLIPVIVANHTLNEQDINSVWNDDLGREYTIGQLKERTNSSGQVEKLIYLLPRIVKGEIEGKDVRDWKTHAQNNFTKLIHKSGAINTTDIVPLKKETEQLRPIEQVRDRTFKIDGKVISVPHGVYYCDELIVSETLKGVNPTQVTKWFPHIETNGYMADITQSFSFIGTSCSVNSVLKTLYPLDFTYYGANQVMTLKKFKDFDSFGVIHKVKPINVWGQVTDLNIPFKTSDITRNDLNIYRKEEHLEDTNDIVDRVVTYLENVQGQKLFGLATGMSLTRGLTKKGVWSQNIPQDENVLFFSPRNNNKFYTRVLSGKAFENSLLPKNYVAEINYYISYYKPNDNFLRYLYKDGNKWCIYITALKQGVFEVDVDNILEGKNFKILENKNIEPLSITVQNNLIYIKNEANTGYLVLIEE